MVLCPRESLGVEGKFGNQQPESGGERAALSLWGARKDSLRGYLAKDKSILGWKTGLSAPLTPSCKPWAFSRPTEICWSLTVEIPQSGICWYTEGGGWNHLTLVSRFTRTHQQLYPPWHPPSASQGYLSIWEAIITSYDFPVPIIPALPPLTMMKKPYPDG